MKKQILSTICLCVPVMVLVSGKIIQRVDGLYSVGGYIGLLGCLLLILGIFAAALMLRSVKCPCCGFVLAEPQKELNRYGILKCPQCGTIVEVKNKSK